MKTEQVDEILQKCVRDDRSRELFDLAAYAKTRDEENAILRKDNIALSDIVSVYIKEIQSRKELVDLLKNMYHIAGITATDIAVTKILNIFDNKKLARFVTAIPVGRDELGNESYNAVIKFDEIPDALYYFREGDLIK